MVGSETEVRRRPKSFGNAASPEIAASVFRINVLREFSELTVGGWSVTTFGSEGMRSQIANKI